MPNEFSRNVRVAEEIRRALAEIVRESIADPRIGLITLTDVDLSKDLKHARVHTSVLEIADQTHSPEQSIEALNHAASFIRGELGRRLKLRAIPRLRFVEDSTERDASRMDALIREVRAVDTAAARKRGEPD